MDIAHKFLRSAITLTATLAVGASSDANANTIRADPNSLQDALLRATDGTHIVLAPGQYGDVKWANHSYHPALTIDASAASFTQLILRDVDGIVVEGGHVDGPREEVMGVVVQRGYNVTLRGMSVTHVRVGITVSESQDIVLEHNEFDGIRSDGINLAADQRVQVLYNDCRNFTPVPAVFSSDGKHLREGDHPDCVQAWPIVGKPQPSDISVIGNTAHGVMQGIFFGDGEKGGYARLMIRDNTLETTYWHGIMVDYASDSVITGNKVSTVPGALMPAYPFRPVTAWIQARHPQNNVVICGNTIEFPKASQDTGRCPASLKLSPKPAA